MVPMVEPASRFTGARVQIVLTPQSKMILTDLIDQGATSTSSGPGADLRGDTLLFTTLVKIKFFPHASKGTMSLLFASFGLQLTIPASTVLN